MKNKILSLVLISSTVLTMSTGVANAADTANTNSKVTGAAKSGGMEIEAEDVDFGKLKISENITSVKVENGVRVLDNTGGEGWQATVKNTSYEDNKDTLHVKFNEVNLIGSEQLFSTGESLLDNQYRDINATAEWGRAPEAGNYQSDLVWTLSPKPEDLGAKYVWGTADAYLVNGNKLIVENGTIADAKIQGIDMKAVNTIEFRNGVYFPENSSRLFSSYHNKGPLFPNLSDFTGLGKVNMSKVKDASFLLEGVNINSPQDLRSWDVSNIKEAHGMFLNSNMKFNAQNLSFDSLENAPELFGGVDFSGTTNPLEGMTFNKLTSFDSFFSHATGLENAGISNWDTSKASDMSMLFLEAKASDSFDISKWDVSKVKDTTSMFTRSNINLQKAGIEKLNFTTELTSVNAMFSDTAYSGELNLNNMKMDNVNETNSGYENYDSMFRKSKIKHVEVSDWRFTSAEKDKSDIESLVFFEFEGTYSDTSNWK